MPGLLLYCLRATMSRPHEAYVLQEDPAPGASASCPCTSAFGLFPTVKHVCLLWVEKRDHLKLPDWLAHWNPIQDSVFLRPLERPETLCQVLSNTLETMGSGMTFLIEDGDEICL